MSGFQKCFLHGQPELYLTGSLPITLVVTTILSAVILVMMKRILLPYDRIIKRLKSGDEEPTDEDREIAMKAVRHMNITTIIFTIVGFVIGNFITFSIALKKGTIPFEIPRLIIVLLHSVSFGGVATLYSICLMEHLLENKQKLLKIRRIDPGKQTRSLRGMLFYMFSVSMLAITVSTFMVTYQMAAAQKNCNLSFYLKWSVVVFVLCLIVTGIPIGMVVNGISKRIHFNSEKIKDLALRGDLTGRIDISVADDLGMMNATINILIDKLSYLLTNLRKQADVVSGSANSLSVTAESSVIALTEMETSLKTMGDVGNTQNELIIEVSKAIDSLKSGSAELSEYMTGQRDVMKENAAAINEMAENINSIANMTKKADDLSRVLSQTSENGNELVTKAVVAISDIQESSNEVQNIVRVIQKIASQTNLLSMNAAIEAAHAGEYGAGFAVVADEVRSLAASSSKSAKDIQVHIKAMVDKINGGVEAISLAGKAFQQIEECVSENQQVIKTLSEAMEEQRKGAVENIRVTTSVTGALARANELAQKQREYSQNVKDAMDRIVAMTEEFDFVINGGRNSTGKLKESVRQVEHSVSDNLVAVSQMENNFSQFTV